LFRDGHEIPKMTQFHRLKCHLLERCWWRSSASLTGFWFEVLLFGAGLHVLMAASALRDDGAI
ncbi:MAG: hypothetical protein WAU74_02140, partial [Pseudolabrys sp.]